MSEVIIECSCGQKTRILPASKGRIMMEVAASDGWAYRTKEEAELYEQSSGRPIRAGWYCGTPDHYQKRRD